MQECLRCHIKIRGSKRCCPLCGGELSGIPDSASAAYPVPERKKIPRLSLLKMAAFILVASEVGLAAVCYILGGVPPWAMFFMIALPLAWLDLAVAFYTRNNVMMLITVQTYLGMIAGIIIDRLTGNHGWAIVWMYPACFVGLAVTTICIGKGNGMLLQDYIGFLGVDFVLSLAVQIALIAVHWNPFQMPAVISMAVMIVMAAGALIFWSREVRSAARRMFHA